MRRTALSIVAFLAVAGVLGYLVSSGSIGSDDSGASRPAGATGATGAVASDQGELGAPVGFGSDGVAVSEELPGLPAIGPTVIRTAQLLVEVNDGGFGEAFNAASLVAGTYGGYVESSTTAGTENRSGELLIRIPSDRFDEALRDLRELGTVQRQQLSGQDVTSEFVDLEARLLTWETQEAVLLDLMSEARTVEETLRIQRELQDVQFRIEQIKGQLRVLENRTDLATISVALRETGAPAVATDRPSLSEAWAKAVDGFLGVWYAVVVGLGYLIPITLVGLLGLLGYRRFLAPKPSAPTA